jgi:hypothetical protein
MKVINGNRRALEKEVVHVLMSDANNAQIDAMIDKLKPAGRLRLVTASQKPEKLQHAPQSPHQLNEGKI